MDQDQDKLYTAMVKLVEEYPPSMVLRALADSFDETDSHQLFPVGRMIGKIRDLAREAERNEEK